MAYIKPEDVTSPSARWKMFDVILNKGEGEPSYALGTWDGKATIVYRWNGHEAMPAGNPQSRGYPTWIVLDEALHAAVIAMAPSEKQTMIRAFFGMRSEKRSDGST